MTEYRPKPGWKKKKKFDTFFRFNSISVCNDMEGANLSQSVHLEFTFSTTIKIKLCLWCLSKREFLQRSKGTEITKLMSLII